jgi:hypothetical protein
MELTLTDVLTVGFALAALIVAIIGIARTGRNIDAATAERLASMSDPATMERLERAHAAADEKVKQALALLAAVVGIIAPLTPLKSDDALKNLLVDIQTPGPAPEVTPVPAPGVG